MEAIYTFAAQNNLNLMFVDIPHIASDATINLSKKKVLSIYLDDNMFSISSYLDKKLKTMRVFEKNSNIDIIHSIELFVDNENITYDNIFVAGSGEVDEFKTELESILRLSAEIFNPFECIQYSDSYTQNTSLMNRPNSFSAAAGICFRKFK